MQYSYASVKLINVINVQECDATKYNSSVDAWSINNSKINELISNANHAQFK